MRLILYQCGELAKAKDAFVGVQVGRRGLVRGEPGRGCQTARRRRTWRTWATSGLRDSLAMVLGDEVLNVDYSDC